MSSPRKELSSVPIDFYTWQLPLTPAKFTNRVVKSIASGAAEKVYEANQLRRLVDSISVFSDSFDKNEDNVKIIRFVVNAQGELRFGREGSPGKKIPAHVQLVRADASYGHNEKVMAAGNILFDAAGRKIVAMTHKSGDFKPAFGSLLLAYCKVRECIESEAVPVDQRLQFAENFVLEKGTYSFGNDGSERLNPDQAKLDQAYFDYRTLLPNLFSSVDITPELTSANTSTYDSPKRTYHAGMGAAAAAGAGYNSPVNKTGVNQHVPFAQDRENFLLGNAAADPLTLPSAYSTASTLPADNRLSNTPVSLRKRKFGPLDGSETLHSSSSLQLEPESPPRVSQRLSRLFAAALESPTSPPSTTSAMQIDMSAKAKNIGTRLQFGTLESSPIKFQAAHLPNEIFATTQHSPVPAVTATAGAAQTHLLATRAAGSNSRIEAQDKRSEPKLKKARALFSLATPEVKDTKTMIPTKMSLASPAKK